ncbi:hypothetical protein CAOG_00954 [Capsaspora owczarzaki ATCC 30864]|uniref:Methyltransferase type 11 domain-containing protein n=1 Tax=Capsaspora owczarzaki (strain ATCC 30864) TaxID=595528 RepID=A0A0D2WJF3_CAPO3|nr:hypothetical protein CAOG_00954 [Capsaspora owczarzaki ATCC 30864]KJE89493.1 hypothetical protein CAOG_000954 [Capsaspora owczarzaki ATCC 30864]|eukprot:XP_004365825.1 hypothetical protein CAOG_00954 [Capsaspora owczarzaki ATCC 30864]
MASYSHLFQGVAVTSKYAAFRPVYPAALYHELLEFMGTQKPGFAIDVACGSGQLTSMLASHFQQVLAFDVSEEQIKSAAAAPNINYTVGSADAIPAQTNTADVVTVAQAMHWFDLPKFYAEVDRVLKPGGTLAVIGYGNCKLANQEANKVIQQFYSGTLKPYWSDRRFWLDNEYADVKLPYEDRARWDGAIVLRYSLEGILGYLSSWSGYHTYLKQNPTLPDPLIAVKADLLRAYATSSTTDVEVDLTWPLFMLLGKKPSH